MPIPFVCPNCGRDYRVADAHAGKRFDCKSCGHKVTVPGGEIARKTTTKILKKAPDEATAKLNKAAPRKRNVPSDTVILSKETPKTSSRAKGVQIKSPPKLELVDEPPPRPARSTPATKAPPEPPKGPLPPARKPTGLKSPADLPAAAKPAAAREMPEPPKSRMVNFLLLLGSAAMCAGFFLPWFTPDLEGFGPIAGFAVPLKAAELVGALQEAEPFGENSLISAMHDSSIEFFAFFALYLIPLLALYAAIDDLRFAGKGKSHWWVRILAALGPVMALAALYASFKYGIDAWLAADGPAALAIDPVATVQAVGYGAWVLLGGWLLTALSIVVRPKVKYRGMEASKAPKSLGDTKPKTRPKLPVPRATN